MDERKLRETLSERDCEIILHVTDALGITGEIPTMWVYMVGEDRQPSKVLLLSKADIARGVTWLDVVRKRR